MLMQLYLFFIYPLFSCFSVETKPKLTFDEFFNYTTFPLLKFSPNGQYLLIQTYRSSWNTSSYENSLWLYNTQNHTKKLITTNIQKSFKVKWSPTSNFILLIPKKHLSDNNTNNSQTNQPEESYIYLYSRISDELLPISLGKDIPLSFTWSNNDSSIYLAALSTDKENDTYKNEWKDVIQYREDLKRKSSIIYRIDLDLNNLSSSVEKTIIRNLSFLIGSLLYTPFGEKLIFSSISTLMEILDGFQLYSLDLRNTSKLTKLTDYEAFPSEIQLSIDYQHILFSNVYC